MSDKTNSKERSLAPSGSKTLTLGSSDLVKRGLKTLLSEQPSDLSVRTWREYGTAMLNGLQPRLPAELDIEFEDLPDNLELGRVVKSTVWINRSHPAYRRAQASRSIGYHIALAVAMALAPLAVDSANENKFVAAFMLRWGANVGTTT
jgi:hypothetical protein